MAVRGGGLAGLHHLQARIEPADAGRGSLAAGVLQRDDAAAGLLGADEIERLQHQRAHRLVAPELRQRRRLRLPWLDRIGDGPERVALLAAEILVVAVELGRVLDIGPADDVLAHARLRSAVCRTIYHRPGGRSIAHNRVVSNREPSRARLPVAAAGCARDLRS